jgi:hypothetical protein
MTASTAVYPLDLVRTLLASQTNKTKHYNGIFKSMYYYLLIILNL